MVSLTGKPHNVSANLLYLYAGVVRRGEVVKSEAKMDFDLFRDRFPRNSAM